MPKLGNVHTERVELPSTKDSDDKAWVQIKSTLLLGDIAELGQELDDTKRAVVLLSHLITDWNFTEDGTADSAKLPINEENINKLELEDFMCLSEKVAVVAQAKGLSDEEKKTSSSVSIPVTETNSPPTI